MVVAAAVARAVDLLRAWSRSSRRVVAALLSADFAVHTAARISQSGETLLLVSTASSILAELAPLDVVGWTLGWALYGYVVYEMSHRLLPALSETTVDWRLRGFLAGATLAAALVVERTVFDPAFTGSPVPNPPSGVGAVALGLVCLATTTGFLLWHDGYPVPTGGLTAALVRSLLWSVAEAVDSPTPDRGFVAAVGVILAAVTLAVVCFALGCLAVLVSLFFPIPELLLLGWVVVGVAESRSRFSPRSLVPSKSSFDLETRLVVAGAVAGHGLKGLAVVFSVVAGLGITLFVFLLFSVPTAALLGVAAELDRLSLRQWAFLGIFLGAALTYAVFSLWYWLRLLDRAPHFLRRWTERVPSEVSPPQFDRRRPLVTRPPGYHLPPSVMFVAAVGLVHSADPETLRLFRPLTAVVCVGAVGVAWSAWVGIRRSPRYPAGHGRAYPVSLAVQLVAMALLADVVTGGTVVAGAVALSPARVVAGVLAVAGSTVAVLSLPLLFYVPEGLIALEHPPWHRRAVAYFFVLGAVVALIGTAGDRLLFAAAGVVPPLWALVYVAHARHTD